jgi:hypothetical protein
MSKEKKRHLIFLLGFKNTGKDTAAGYFNDCSYGNFDIVGFADALKKDYYGSLGIEYDRNTEDRDFKETHRSGIIRYGEGMKQRKGATYWIEKALDDYLFDPKSKKGIIVPDCRRVEELFWYRDFLNNSIPKYTFIRERFQPHFFAIHREGAEDNDKDYLTHNTVRVMEEMFLMNRFIKNYKDLKHLKGLIEEIYAVRLR